MHENHTFGLSAGGAGVRMGLASGKSTVNTGVLTGSGLFRDGAASNMSLGFAVIGARTRSGATGVPGFHEAPVFRFLGARPPSAMNSWMAGPNFETTTFTRSSVGLAFECR
jgi:hypothetical protein